MLTYEDGMLTIKSIKIKKKKKRPMMEVLHKGIAKRYFSKIFHNR